jgi:flagellar biosynthesis protein FliQ
MTMDQIVALGRSTLEMALWIAAPVLLLATCVSLLINVVQVLTSIQETTIATVPRLATVTAALFVLMPWMLRHLARFTIQLFSNLTPYTR